MRGSTSTPTGTSLSLTPHARPAGLAVHAHNAGRLGAVGGQPRPVRGPGRCAGGDARHHRCRVFAAGQVGGVGACHALRLRQRPRGHPHANGELSGTGRGVARGLQVAPSSRRRRLAHTAGADAQHRPRRHVVQRQRRGVGGWLRLLLPPLAAGVGALGHEVRACDVAGRRAAEGSEREGPSGSIRARVRLGKQTQQPGCAPYPCPQSWASRQLALAATGEREADAV